MNKFALIAKILIILGVVFIVGSCSIFNYKIGAVSKSDEIKEIIVESGDTYMSISKKLKDNNLIKSEFYFKLYVKLTKPKKLEMGKYELSENMGVKKIIEILEKGSNYNPDTVSITFKEGLNVRQVIKLITENTNNKEEDIYNLLNDEKYLDELINNYWFITDEIKNKEIYYSLEGYLFPDTYSFTKDMEIKQIFKRMLDNMEVKIEPYKKQIEDSKYSFHEIITLASIVELEGSNASDRGGVAGVFYNRLENNWSLGSDMTTYYAIKVDDYAGYELWQKELDDKNAYNTRVTDGSMNGKLPVSAICNPGIESIEAAINPTKHNYFYFVADKNKKTYFQSTYQEFSNKIAELKNSGLWYTY